MRESLSFPDWLAQMLATMRTKSDAAGPVCHHCGRPDPYAKHNILVEVWRGRPSEDPDA